jgi:hypothetical protein
MRQLVHQHHIRLAGDDRIDVHLLQRHAAMRHLLARDYLQSLQRLGGQRPPVRLHVTDDNIG